MRLPATQCRRLKLSLASPPLLFARKHRRRQLADNTDIRRQHFDNNTDMARAVVFTLTALLALFEFGSCLQCYQCNSQSDPNCKDPFSSSRALVDCNTQDTVNYNRQYLSQILPRELLDSVTGAPRYCTKLVMKNGSTVRTCLDANPTDLSHTCKMLTNIAQVTDPSRMIEHCSVCDKDRCNGAASIVASLPLLFAAIAAYLYSKQ